MVKEFAKSSAAAQAEAAVTFGVVEDGAAEGARLHDPPAVGQWGANSAHGFHDRHPSHKSRPSWV